ncbi:hypothetical protein C4564_02690 [Candidatus Microgenomates bacterium]|nr:MAG: hypothetical protein C4564_02690 [Candidatus Microgenomates bacterium]
MSYQNLTAKQIYMEEVAYTLDDFARDFKARLKDQWGEKLDDKNKGGNTLYQAILIFVVFASQSKPLKLTVEIVLGTVNEETVKLTKDILGMYEKEVEILEGLQMKIFLDNLKKYHLSDSLNLKMLNANFRIWLEKALDQRD